MNRPDRMRPTRSTPAATIRTSTTTRRRITGRTTARAAGLPNRPERSGRPSSGADALRREPRFHLAADCRQTIVCLRLEAQHQHGLRIRRPNQSPSVAEEDAHAINVDHVVRLLEVRGRRVHYGELAVVRTVGPNL